MIHVHHRADDSSPLSALLDDESDTAAAGAALATALCAGLVIYLRGDLGAGKTTLVRGVLRALGHDGKVKSPTYTLIEPYLVSRLNLYHFDFYRFAVPEEYLEAGLDEYFDGSGVCLVEWPDKAVPYIAAPDLEIRLTVSGPGRRLEALALTEAGRTCIRKLDSDLNRKPT
ncbi:tRNA (adenosine(37)-N6)-threonylcarbamoyltransferase complex ATPase subunit type 1 TsaE [Aromatoleum toluclasticum]|uniref:tRNA (adenosine(37)-N6)-threonylcarbamoyltransferase complex ATPase subunit type 1 TsaE n=1 Tax=Aromatoleum toluclasticum TaxID=92003 RepID=UPI000475F08D|nr:tRNA (adenosine(37)-N6)-threonylcarbamoyltransferase complex ATPase subunit type 1 TsaE [Aromatoleum toluclasticum]MCC4117016.1 tRNA (adenosine(37)-N6)-threonylcarbamoyltransferase complex ATPase subunit type 1 TsaE [Aromatoleum toluclasticum]